MSLSRQSGVAVSFALWGVVALVTALVQTTLFLFHHKYYDNMKKTVTVELKWLQMIVISIIASIALVFAINHAGTFLTHSHQQTQYDNESRAYLVSYQDPKANVTLYYKSPFGTVYTYQHIFQGNEVGIADYGIDTYEVKVEGYSQSLALEINYILLLSVLLTVIQILASKYKIRLS